jgi:hypothetical protein
MIAPVTSRNIRIALPPLTARSIKITLVLNTAEAAAVLRPFADTRHRVAVKIAVEGHRLSADFSKAIHKALAAVEEHGPEGVAVLIQGKLVSGGRVIEAGLVAQPRTPKPAQGRAVK